MNTGPEISEALGRTPPSETKSRRAGKRKRLLVTAFAVVAVVALFAPTWLGSWAPIAHRTCAKGDTVATWVGWIPAVLVNSPYGGSATGNGSIPPTFFTNGWYAGAVGVPTSNGSVAGPFVQNRANLSAESNDTVLGPGLNAPCDQEYSSESSELGQLVYSGTLWGSGNRSDAGEPRMFNLTSSPGGSTSFLENGFSSVNMGDVSTCNRSGIREPVSSPGLTVWVPFDVGNSTTTVAYALPFAQSFHYSFPANFGTWQVDNLSAPGGPGGGWAFNFVGPCV